MPPKPRPETVPKESGIITKATLRAAERLGIRNNVLARIVGVSEPTVRRMRKGDYVLERGQKGFALPLSSGWKNPRCLLCLRKRRHGGSGIMFCTIALLRGFSRYKMACGRRRIYGPCRWGR